MPKFVLIDPSIQDYQGHYFEYALRVLRAAKSQGYDPVAATHRKLAESHADIRIRAVYRLAFWFSGHGSRWKRPWEVWRQARRNWLERLSLSLTYSWLGLWWSHRSNWRGYLGRRSLHAGVEWWLPILLLLAYGIFALRSAAILTWNLNPARGLLRWLARVVGAYSRQAKNAWVDFAAALTLPVRVAAESHQALTSWFWNQIRLRQFAQDTARLLSLEALSDDDHVLVSTTSATELLALAKLFERRPHLLRGQWHLVFRHNLHAASDEQLYGESQRPLRNAFQYFRDRVRAGNVHLYTDTEELTAQHNSLAVLPFHTLPVPVASEYRATHTQAAARRALRIAYVGDARTEKGYHLLPKLVDDLWGEWGKSGKVRFVFQSNFSTREPAPDVAVARAQLQSHPSDHVQLLTEPLSPAEYREQVLAADVLLLPYDGQTYYARSSGILAEALTAGIPVVAPAGSWMAMQLTKSHYEYHQELMLRSRLVETRRLPDSSWKIVDVDRSRPMFNGSLRLSGRRRCVCRVRAPREANELLITFRQTCARRGQFVELQVTQCSAGGRPRRESLHVVGGCTTDVSLLVRLVPRTRAVQLCARNAYSSVPMELSNVQFDFLALERRPPRGAVGVIIHAPDELSDATAEILRHYAHYRETAAANASDWSRRHSPEQLVQTLKEVAGRPNGDTKRVPPPRPHYLQAGRSLYSTEKPRS